MIRRSLIEWAGAFLIGALVILIVTGSLLLLGIAWAPEPGVGRAVCPHCGKPIQLEKVR